MTNIKSSFFKFFLLLYMQFDKTRAANLPRSENIYKFPQQMEKNNWGILSGIGENILFGIGNGAEFRPQNRVIESPFT